MIIELANINRDNMQVKEVTAKSILRKNKKIDSWFLSRFGMNLYRGCTHNCIYCDGRSKKYNVEGVFGNDIQVKVNAIDLLQKELNLINRNAKSKKGYIMVGGGVGDSYQPVEKKYNLTRKTLELLYKYNLPIHILTKSTLVDRDIDIIKRINEKSKAIVSFSFSSVDDKISSIFEPNVPSPTDRLEEIRILKKEGISCGMFLLPVIPFITDKPKLIEDAIFKAKKFGCDFIIFGGMTLKEGRQSDYFKSVIKKEYPELLPEISYIYKKDIWGQAIPEYYDSINLVFNILSSKYKIPKRIPLNLFRDVLDDNDLVIVVLEHIDYLLRLQGKKSSYGFAAYSLSKLNRPFSEIKTILRDIKGVGPITEKLVLEIIETKTSVLYEKLIDN